MFSNLSEKMDLILCHTIADFDTLGAAVGLSWLYPGTRIVLSGGCHPAVQDFLALHRDEYPFIERRSVNPQTIHSLKIVDTQQRDRLGLTAAWLDLPGVEISVYDHHLSAVSDIPAQTRTVEAVGAVSTLAVEQLQQRGIELTPIAATVMALGIHVDTGSLTYDHTTPRDVLALAWLMQQGANLKVIADYVEPGLSPELQRLLRISLENWQSETVQGQRLAWVWLQTEAYVPGLSSLTARLMELVEAEAFFLGHQYTRSGSDAGTPVLSVIGRSRIPGTDLHQLFQPLGGGGHPKAAAVTLRSAQPEALFDNLRAQFKAQIPQPPTAQELMSSPVRTIRPETTIAQAQRILLRYGHSGLSVVDEADRLVGIISRRDLDIALHHGFSHAPVKGYMSTRLRTITPETALPEIESLMVTYDIGRLPVLQHGELVGIVTRTDVLRQLHHDRARPDRDFDPIDTAAQHPAVTPAAWKSRLNLQRLALPLQKLLTIAAQQAQAQGWHLYLVGGGVRDLLLAEDQQPVMLKDIDLVVDGCQRSATVGAGVALARSLQASYPEARLEVHGQFQTAALLWHKHPELASLWMDIATARTEFYPYPAANPEVEASSIRQDLYRRDFTINALAWRLTEPRSGELLDFFGGVLDLAAKQLQVLHANSFIEDPTRIYRGVRFSVRLGLTIAPQTEGFIRHAIASGIYAQRQTQSQAQSQTRSQTQRAPALETRLKAELRLILEASYWKAALLQLADLDALRCIHPTLTLTRDLWRRLRLADRLLQMLQTAQTQTRFESTALIVPWQFRLEVLLAQLETDARSAVARHLQLSADAIDRLEQLAIGQDQIQTHLASCQTPSQIVKLLQPYDLLLLALVAVHSDRVDRRSLWRYFTQWAQVQAPLNGHDLKALGYKPGRLFKAMLEQLRFLTLDGKIHDATTAKDYLTQHYPLPYPLPTAANPSQIPLE